MKTDMYLTAAASHFKRAVLDDSESHRGHIEYLAPFGHPCRVRRQRLVAAIASPRQRVHHRLGRLGDPLERRSFVADLAADWLIRRFAQRARLLGQAIGRWRLAGVVTGLVRLRFERLQTRQQRQDEDTTFLLQPWPLNSHEKS